MTIAATEIVPLLIEASPGFKAKFDEIHEDDPSDGEPLPYLDMAAFARYVLALLEMGETSDFPAIFATVERLIEEGDEETVGLATVGILEDIQSYSSWSSVPEPALLRWLGSKSRSEWDRLKALWAAAGGSLANVIRLERGQVPKAPPGGIEGVSDPMLKHILESIVRPQDPEVD